jgi:hypothetical protein
MGSDRFFDTRTKKKVTVDLEIDPGRGKKQEMPHFLYFLL